MTFDFINYAKCNEKFMYEIRECIISETDNELCTDTHRLRFNGIKKIVIVEPLSDKSPFHWKIIPKGIKYENLIKVLNGDWDMLESGIVDI